MARTRPAQLEQGDALRDAGRRVLSTIAERALARSDVGAGLALSASVGWNQVAADWELMIDAGRGIALVDGDDVVATAIALPYGSVGWLSMILVRADRRGERLAARVVERAIAALRDAGIVPVLDATPAGREVYVRSGFVDGWTSQRLRAEGRRAPLAFAPPPGVTIRAAGDGDLAAIAALDRTALGAARPAVLRALRARLPAAAAVAEREGRCIGFALGRDGRTAAQIGPVVADDPAVGAALLAHALAAVRGPVLVDVPDRHGALQRALLAARFVVERPFTRMTLGDRSALASPAPFAAIAGPELG